MFVCVVDGHAYGFFASYELAYTWIQSQDGFPVAYAQNLYHIYEFVSVDSQWFVPERSR